MRYLKPIIAPKKEIKELETILLCIFSAILKKIHNQTFQQDGKKFFNARTDYPNLIHALRDGLLIYDNGFVYGNFNASTSRALHDLGARYVSSKKAFELQEEKLPIELSALLRDINQSNSIQQTRQLESLEEVNPIFNPSMLKDILLRTVDRLQDQFISSIKSADISIIPNLTDVNRSDIAREYINNLELDVKNFSDKMVIDMRQAMVKRLESKAPKRIRLSEVLMHEYNIARKKAVFLASQETSLLVSKFRESRYKEIGITKYKWSTSHDLRVRPANPSQVKAGEDHKSLDGMIFSWDDPPVVNHLTGKRANPGEDYGCRCVARPIFE